MFFSSFPGGVRGALRPSRHVNKKVARAWQTDEGNEPTPQEGHHSDHHSGEYRTFFFFFISIFFSGAYKQTREMSQHLKRAIIPTIIVVSIEAFFFISILLFFYSGAYKQTREMSQHLKRAIIPTIIVVSNKESMWNAAKDRKGGYPYNLQIYNPIPFHARRSHLVSYHLFSNPETPRSHRLR